MFDEKEQQSPNDKNDQAGVLPDLIEPFRLLVKWLMFYLFCGSRKSKYLLLRARTALLLAKLGLYERASIKLLRSLIVCGDVVVDVGANYGIYTEVMSHLVGEEGRVLAFEPLAHVFQELRKGTLGYGNVSCYNIALSDQEGEMVSMHVPFLFGKVPEPALASLEEFDGECETVSVRCRRLDTYIDELTGLSFVKVDIEGHEKRFLCGAEEVIKKFRPVIQLEEQAMNHAFSWYRDFCEKFDYRLCLLKKGRLVQMRSYSRPLGVERNFFFRSAEDNAGTEAA